VKLLQQLIFVTITIPKENNGFVGKTQYPKPKQGRVAKSLGRTIIIWVHIMMEQAKKFPSKQIGIMKLYYIQM
jgi:hypothetical protein